MKKVLAICLTLVMVMSLGVAAFAAPGSFISSPSMNKAPVLISFENGSPDCTAKVVVTAYADRDKLPKASRENLEKAYDVIVNTKDLSTLNSGLKDLAKEAKANAASLSVSDLFDVSITGCKDHAKHGSTKIVLQPETLKNYVCLLRYCNGEWIIVEDAKLANDGKYLEFSADESAAYAIVVNADVVPPYTGDNSAVIICSVVMALSAAAIVVLLATSKKRTRKATEI